MTSSALDTILNCLKVSQASRSMNSKSLWRIDSWNITSNDSKTIHINFCKQNEQLIMNYEDSSVFDVSICDPICLDVLDTPDLMISLDIMKHSIFNIETPYLQCFNRNGSLISTDDFNMLLNHHNSLSKDASSTISLVDHTVHPFGLLIQEEHPITRKICSTIHVCELSKYMKTLMSSESGLTSIQLSCLYFMSWLTFIGPYFGYTINCNEYNECVMLIKNSNML